MNIHTYFEPVDFLRRGYHVAAFKGQTEEQEREIRRWCWSSFGPEGYLVNTNEIRWKDGISWGELRLQREEDLALFLLRWS